MTPARGIAYAEDAAQGTLEPTEFVPAWPLAGGHAQTIWPALMRTHRPGGFVAERWPTEDGEAIEIDRLTVVRSGQPGVVVFHGLEGSSRAPYVTGLLRRLAARGWNAAAVNFRSCGPLQLASRRLYHSGDTRDLPFLFATLRRLWGDGPLGAVGFSVGGNILLKWLGEQGEAAPLAAAVAVSVPYDLGACARTLDGPGFWPRTYRRRFLPSLRRKAAAVPAVDARALSRCTTFAAFDQLVTAPLNGFASAEDYWVRSSCAGFLARIARPALLIAARDDPFVPAHAIPETIIAGNPRLVPWISERGGHVGFVAGRLWRPRFVADDLAVSFLASRL